MDFMIALLLIGAGFLALKNAEQRQRIALLGTHLQKYQLEKLMEQLTEGYLRALGEPDGERREQIWQLLENTEQAVADQLERLALDVARLDAAQTRISRWPVAVPLASRLLPASTFDLREALALHASGVASVVKNTRGLNRRDKAFMLSAELFLFQHTCHWYCRSRTVASARLAVRHRTRYEQVLAAVSPATRRGWEALLAR
jgi:hypothetical protein